MDHQRNVQRILYLDYDGVRMTRRCTRILSKEFILALHAGLFRMGTSSSGTHYAVQGRSNGAITQLGTNARFFYAKSRLNEPIKSRVIGSNFHSVIWKNPNFTPSKRSANRSGCGSPLRGQLDRYR